MSKIRATAMSSRHRCSRYSRIAVPLAPPINRPIAADFTATGRLAPDADWPRFVDSLHRHGKARISAAAELAVAGTVAGRLTAEFVALASE